MAALFARLAARAAERIRRAVGRGASDRQGVSAVEFALVAPVLFVILAGIADVTRLIWYQTEVTQATRAGMQFATANPGDTAGIAAVVAASTSLNGSSGFVVDAASCGCATAASATLIFLPCATITCASPNRKYVRISATYDWTPMFGSLSVFPDKLNTTVVLRVQ